MLQDHCRMWSKCVRERGREELGGIHCVEVNVRVDLGVGRYFLILRKCEVMLVNLHVGGYVLVRECCVVMVGCPSKVYFCVLYNTIWILFSRVKCSAVTPCPATNFTRGNGRSLILTQFLVYSGYILGSYHYKLDVTGGLKSSRCQKNKKWMRIRLREHNSHQSSDARKTKNG